MAIRFPRLTHARKIIRRSLMAANHTDSTTLDVPRGCLAVYVGECEKRRFVIPISYLDQPLFQELLSQAEEEFGFDHPMGALTIPCGEAMFIDLMSHLSRS